MLIVIALLIATAANAEPLPPQPQPKTGAICPTGWNASPTSGYCVPGPNNKCRMMPKLGAPCPPGWSASFNYCVETNCRGGGGLDGLSGAAAPLARALFTTLLKDRTNGLFEERICQIHVSLVAFNSYLQRAQ